jgi:hypothetical protein
VIGNTAPSGSHIRQGGAAESSLSDTGSPGATESGRAESKATQSTNTSAAQKKALVGSIFHEHWWLSAASGGQFSEVKVEERNTVVGRLPFVAGRRAGFRTLRMPAFTHVLGPVIDSGEGKPQTLLKNRVNISRLLIEQLPPFDYFMQAIDPSLANELAAVDGLAFQESGFKISPQYTFEIDCRSKLDALFGAMHLKARQHVRLAEKAYSVEPVEDPQRFVDFYLATLNKRGLKSNIPLERFHSVFSECRNRGCGEALAAVQADGVPVAMTFLIWGYGTMYYLLSARAPDLPDKGSINLLIWSAMKKAHELGLVFDLDGVSTTGTARFLSGFGGQIKTRLIVTRARPLYSTLQHFGRMAGLIKPSNFT